MSDRGLIFTDIVQVASLEMACCNMVESLPVCDALRLRKSTGRGSTEKLDTARTFNIVHSQTRLQVTWEDI